MITTNIFSINYTELQKDINRFTQTSHWKGKPNYLIMSTDTLDKIKKDTPSPLIDVFYFAAMTSDELYGIPIATNNSLGFGLIDIV